MTTAADVEAEHQAILATLTHEQRRAIRRVLRATGPDGFVSEQRLRTIFETEAATRSQLDDMERAPIRRAA